MMVDYLFGITDTGKVRDNNEDVFIAQELMNGQFMIAGVIDGVGGYEGGEIAAALTKEALLSEMAVIGADVLTQLEIAFTLANEEIFARKLANKELSSMACVATVALIDKASNTLYYIHVGDTRLYLFRDNTLIKLSSDQSPVGFLEDSGRITEEAAMQHPDRNLINQALGLGSPEEMSANYFETGSSPFLPGDLILICSDGLTDMVNKEMIAAVLHTSDSLQAKAEKLVAAANQAGGNDNITIVLAKNDKARVAHAASRPAADLFTPLTEPAAKPAKTPEPAAAKLEPLTEPAAPAAEPPLFLDEEKPKVDQKNPYLKEAVQSPGQTRALDSRSGNNALLFMLFGLCILFLASTLWLFFTNPPTQLKDSGNPGTAKTAAPDPLEKLLNETLLKLKSDTLMLSAEVYKTPVRLTKALLINRDTLIIRTKGNVVLLRDSAYKGPAISLAASCKYVSVDQLVLQNFETGIVSYKNVLDLKNVKFSSCKYPLQVLFEFPDQSYVNGRVSKRAFQADSLAKK